MDDGSSSNSSSLDSINDAIISCAAGLSTIACIISLVVLIYFKLYRSFIYRLVLYSFISLIILSSSTIATVMNQQGTLPHGNSTQIVSQVSLLVIFVLATIINLCICILSLCNHQFTYRADISLISGFFVISCVNAIIFILGGEIPYIIFYSIPIIILVNVFLTLLTLVPLCGRACGYNMCGKTKESHRKALKGILPLLILPLSSYVSF